MSSAAQAMPVGKFGRRSSRTLARKTVASTHEKTTALTTQVEPKARALQLDVELILVCLSGRGDKDLAVVLAHEA